MPHAGHDARADLPLRWIVHFNSRAPCGARHCDSDTVAPSNPFQLTCPVRGTTTAAARNVNSPEFQLTCPVRGTTRRNDCILDDVGISTHVPRAGHDPRRRRRLSSGLHFNSRAPCGARRLAQGWISSFTRFQLTCPVRGTTSTRSAWGTTERISTHVPRAGHDPTLLSTDFSFGNFNSRAPCGARHRRLRRRTARSGFQLTCPVRGTTQTFETTDGAVRISTHVPHAGHDRALGRHVVRQDNFNSRAPCGARQYGACCGVLY